MSYTVNAAGGDVGSDPLYPYANGIAAQVHSLGDRGSLRKMFQRFIWMTISYVKKCADSIKISLINLAVAYDIFGLLAKNAHFYSL